MSKALAGQAGAALSALAMMRLSIVLVTLLPLAAPAAAQDRAVPYWASLRAKQVNMHVGPARGYGVSWVYKRAQLPMKVLRLKEGWRLVQDPDGTRGWMLAQFLSPERGALVTGPGLVEVRAEGGADARVLWRLEPGVVGKLGACGQGWCRFDVTGHVGFIEQQRLWGSGEP